MSQIVNPRPVGLLDRNILNIQDMRYLRELKEWIVGYLSSHDNTDELDEFVGLYSCHPGFSIHDLLEELSAKISVHQQEFIQRKAEPF